MGGEGKAAKRKKEIKRQKHTDTHKHLHGQCSIRRPKHILLDFEVSSSEADRADKVHYLKYRTMLLNNPINASSEGSASVSVYMRRIAHAYRCKRNML